jgi:hypothetical protein
VEVIDTKVLVLDKILTKLKQASMTSALDYIKSLLNDFILSYLIFSVVLLRHPLVESRRHQAKHVGYQYHTENPPNRDPK